MPIPIDAPRQSFMIGDKVMIVPEPQSPGDAWPEAIQGWQRLYWLGPGSHKVDVLGNGTIDLPGYAAIWVPDPASEMLPYITGYPFIPPTL